MNCCTNDANQELLVTTEARRAPRRGTEDRRRRADWGRERQSPDWPFEERHEVLLNREPRERRKNDRRLVADVSLRAQRGNLNGELGTVNCQLIFNHR